MVDASLLKRAYLPPVHWEASLDKVPDNLVYKKYVVNWLNSCKNNVMQAKGLMFLGKVGRGKSALAAICLKQALSLGIVSHWVSFRRLADIKINGEQFSETHSLWDRLCRVPLLVLDELQVDPSTGNRFQGQLVEDLIRFRVDNRKCSIITSNYSTSEIEKNHPTLFSILGEAVIPIPIDGIDFRAVKRKHLGEGILDG
jgi:DNA replication protein DnaC